MGLPARHGSRRALDGRRHSPQLLPRPSPPCAMLWTPAFFTLFCPCVSLARIFPRSPVILSWCRILHAMLLDFMERFRLRTRRDFTMSQCGLLLAGPVAMAVLLTGHHDVLA